MARPVLPTVERVPHASAPAADPCSVPRLRAGSFTGSEPQRAVPDDRCSIPTAHAPSRPPLSSGAAVRDPTEGQRGAAGSLPGSSLPGCGPRLPAASRKCVAHECRRAEGSEIKSHVACGREGSWVLAWGRETCHRRCLWSGALCTAKRGLWFPGRSAGAFRRCWASLRVVLHALGPAKPPRREPCPLASAGGRDGRGPWCRLHRAGLPRSVGGRLCRVEAPAQ